MSRWDLGRNLYFPVCEMVGVEVEAVGHGWGPAALTAGDPGGLGPLPTLMQVSP